MEKARRKLDQLPKSERIVVESGRGAGPRAMPLVVSRLKPVLRSVKAAVLVANLRASGHQILLASRTHTISIPTGQWSEPVTLEWMNARFSRGRNDAETRK
jgi:hypothetical protein